MRAQVRVLLQTNTKPKDQPVIVVEVHSDTSVEILHLGRDTTGKLVFRDFRPAEIVTEEIAMIRLP